MANNELPDICPDLGLINDRTTACSFPSTAHVCFHRRPAAWVSEAHQAKYCLGDYRQCPLNRNQPYPPEIFEGPAEHGFWLRRNARLALALVVVAVIVVGFGGQLWAQAPAEGPGDAEPAPSIIGAITRALATWTLAPSPTPTITAQPTEVWTPIPTSGPEVGTPVGPFAVMLYVVKPGDSLASIANAFGTRVAVLTTANGLTEPVSIFPGQFLVIPLGVQDAAGLPRFVPYRVAGETENLQDIAAQFGADAAQIRTVNDLGTSSVVPRGRLLLIPIAPLPTSLLAGGVSQSVVEQTQP